jgi:OFA family oxalate/formate antiporter-like MFS transporter
MGGCYAPQVSTLARWFVTRRNLIIGFVLSGGGIGGLIASPLANWLILTQGWRIAFVILGVILFITIVIPAQFLKRDPKEMGQLPYKNVALPETAKEIHSEGTSFREAVATKQYWMAGGVYSAWDLPCGASWCI